MTWTTVLLYISRHDYGASMHQCDPCMQRIFDPSTMQSGVLDCFNSTQDGMWWGLNTLSELGR